MILRIMKFSADVKSEMKFAIEGIFHWKKRPEKGRFFRWKAKQPKQTSPYGDNFNISLKHIRFWLPGFPGWKGSIKSNPLSYMTERTKYWNRNLTVSVCCSRCRKVRNNSNSTAVKPILLARTFIVEKTRFHFFWIHCGNNMEFLSVIYRGFTDYNDHFFMWTIIRYPSFSESFSYRTFGWCMYYYNKQINFRSKSNWNSWFVDPNSFYFRYR